MEAGLAPVPSVHTYILSSLEEFLARRGLHPRDVTFVPPICREEGACRGSTDTITDRYGGERRILMRLSWAPILRGGKWRAEAPSEPSIPVGPSRRCTSYPVPQMIQNCSRRFLTGFGLGLAATLFLVLGGCDPNVDLFRESNQYYSIFGALNVSADTQYVRVEPLRDGLLTSAPATLDATVTLTNLDEGRTVTLRDSVFHYGEDTRAHNFFTTSEIALATSYRLVVDGPGEAETRVETRVPQAMPRPDVSVPVADCFPNCIGGGPPDCDLPGGPETRIASATVEGIERLVAVRALYTMERPRGAWAYDHLADTVQTGPRTTEARVDYGRDWCSIPRPIDGSSRLQRRIQIIVAAGSADWPDFLGLDFETELLPGTASNVEGGVGFFGSVVTDTVTVYPHGE